MGKKLSVFEASAGSGKTYTLSEKFSRYLLNDFEKDPYAYRRILAVTFTNKATFEMKTRIIDRLWNYSQHSSSETEKAAARKILKSIVHDYTMFRVSTIDSFFQTILRSFALELGRQGAFETTLDAEGAVEAAVEAMYSKLGENKELLSLMKDISLSRIDDNKSWNWRKEVLKISKEVINQEYWKLWTASGESGVSLAKAIQNLYKEESTLQRVFVAEVIAIDKQIQREYAQLSFDKEEFKRSGRGESALYKLLTGRLGYVDAVNSKILEPCPDVIVECNLGSLEKYFKKSTPPHLVKQIRELVTDRVRSIVNLYSKYYSEYITLQLLKINMKETSLLDFVAKELYEYLNNEQLTLLSDAPQILSDLINGSDTPFVYEKVGGAINHYLLDEFQDTSDIQWQNFRPLLHDGISRGFESLLVGDVKQSIYRWRGGDWGLFKNELPKQFSEDYNRHILDTNYRSLSNIVKFNNSLFASVQHGDVLRAGVMVASVQEYLREKLEEAPEADSMVEEIEMIYRNAGQKVRPEYVAASQKGLVNVVCCNKVKNTVNKYIIKPKQFILADMVKKIKNLVTGPRPLYNYGDIAVLASTNKDTGYVADYLIRNGINIVSGESLRVDSCTLISLVIEILKKIENPSSKGFEAVARISSSKLQNLNLLEPADEEGKNFLKALLSGNTLYEICREIIRVFFPKVEGSDLAFVKAFLDRVLEYTSANGTEISGFLRWWDQNADNFYIPEPTAGQAVRIMTMHKAKGLDFKVLFIPFLRDDMISLKDSKWFAMPGSLLGYSGPVLLPLKDAKMKDSLWAEAFRKELQENCIDSLNLAYVSFTRPKERLYIYTVYKHKGSIGAALSNFCENNSKGAAAIFTKEEKTLTAFDASLKDCGFEVDTTKQPFEYSEYVFGNVNEESYSALNPSVTESMYAIMDVELDGKNNEFASKSSKANLRTVYDKDDNIRRGILYHKLFSYIGVPSKDGVEHEVDCAVQQFLKENPNSILGSDCAEIAAQVISYIREVEAFGWFLPDKTIKNESTIISGAEEYRPDRVIVSESGSKREAIVVDYKFGKYNSGSKQHAYYNKQVEKYRNLLLEMGYSDVKGYLWYVLEHTVVDVSENKAFEVYP